MEGILRSPDRSEIGVENGSRDEPGPLVFGEGGKQDEIVVLEAWSERAADEAERAERASRLPRAARYDMKGSGSVRQRAEEVFGDGAATRRGREELQGGTLVVMPGLV
jgi:hypothetical protein